MDEVGRGPLAGPVTACAVMIPAQRKFEIQNSQFKAVKLGDSKKLTGRQREELYEVLTHISYIKWAVASVGPDVIDRINIFEATKRAAVKAIEKLNEEPDLIIIDGNMVLPIEADQKAIPKADEQFLPCSIASIIAKVTRDRYMERMHDKYPRYGFDRHKGYGTQLHYAMLKKYGPSPIHRRSFRLT